MTVTCPNNKLEFKGVLEPCFNKEELKCELYQRVLYSGLCSSRARWPLASNFCPWATRKSQDFSYKSYAGHPRFYSFKALRSLQFSLEHSLDIGMLLNSYGVIIQWKVFGSSNCMVQFLFSIL